MTNAYGLSASAGRFVDITPINHPPTAKNRTVTVPETQPVAEASMSYHDANGDPLTITVVKVPSDGDFYADAVSPENLITAPGGVYPEGTQFFLDTGVEVDKWIVHGVTDFAEFQYLVSDGEFESNVATVKFRILRHNWPPDMTLTPQAVGVVQSDLFVEFEIIAAPYTSAPVSLYVLDLPVVGEVGFNIFEGLGMQMEHWHWSHADSEYFLPGITFQPHEDGTYRLRLRYRHDDEEPTEFGAPDMVLRAAPVGAPDYFEPEVPIPGLFELDLGVLPYTCNPAYIADNCCHASCFVCEPVDCDCVTGDAMSIYFDGSQPRHIDLGMTDEFGPAMNHGTIEMWVRMNSTDATRSIFRMWDLYNLFNAPYWHLQMFEITANRSVESTFMPGSLKIHQSYNYGGDTMEGGYHESRSYDVPELFDGQWHHLAVRTDTSASELSLFVNGQPRLPSESSSSSSPHGAMQPFTIPVRLGVNSSQEGVHDVALFKGHLRDVRFWNVAREDSEIAEGMHGVDPSSPGLFGAWKLDEGAGSVAANAADPGGATDGILMNHPWWIAPHEDGCAPTNSADLNHDGTVNVADLLILLSAWGPCITACPADLDGDGAVNVADLLILLANWG